MPLKSSYRTLASLVGVLFLAMLLVVPSFWTFAQVKEAARSRQHAYEEIIQAETLLSGLSDAETSQRGFLLTGNEAFLAPYLAVRDGLQAQLVELCGNGPGWLRPSNAWTPWLP
jgi:CHASE3 domain sensor protein